MIAQNLPTMLKPIGLFFLIMVGIVAGLLVYNYRHRTPKADVTFIRVDRDTTFYIGRSASESSPGGHLAVWLTGDLIDSTAALAITYGAEVPPTYAITYLAGRVDTTVSGDFYSERAKITYLHRGGHERKSASAGHIWLPTRRLARQLTVSAAPDLGAKSGFTWGGYVVDP